MYGSVPFCRGFARAGGLCRVGVLRIAGIFGELGDGEEVLRKVLRMMVGQNGSRDLDVYRSMYVCID